jgi:hypothetical protein
MTNIRLPRWLIGRKMLRGGLRLDPMPKPKYKETTSISRYAPYAPTSTLFGSTDTLYDVGGQIFAGWEYRFWAAALEEDKVCVTECRCCNAVYMDRVNRRAHLAETGCSKKLVAAFKLLQADKICVICSAATTKEKWGVPLCGEGCIKMWCEEESQPQALQLALDLLAYKEGQNGV